MSQLGENSLKAGVRYQSHLKPSSALPWSRAPLYKSTIRFGVFQGQLVTELNHPGTRIKGKRSWLVLQRGSNAFWELDSVVPASLCLNEVLLRGQEEVSSCLEQQASSAVVRAAGGQELPQRMFWDLLEEPRLRLMEVRNFK